MNIRNGSCIRRLETPPTITEVVVNDELLGFHLEDGRFISVPLGFYPTLALATPEERGRFEINGSSAYWPELDADIGVEGLLAGAREHHHYARQAVERAVRLGRLPKTALEKLPAEKREVLLLSKYQEKKYQEIGEILGCSEGAVKVKVFRALQELRVVYRQLEKLM